MKKRMIVILIIVLILCIPMIKKYIIIKSYDIVIGTRKDSGFPTYFLYGYRNGKLTKINEKSLFPNYDANKSNFYRITGTDELITYFDYNTWYKMYKDLNYGETR